MPARERNYELKEIMLCHETFLGQLNGGGVHAGGLKFAVQHFTSVLKIQGFVHSDLYFFLKKRRFSEDVGLQKNYKSSAREVPDFGFGRIHPERTRDKSTTDRSLRSPFSWRHTGAGAS